MNTKAHMCAYVAVLAMCVIVGVYLQSIGGVPWYMVTPAAVALLNILALRNIAKVTVDKS